MKSRRLDGIAIAIVVLVFAIPLRGLLRTQGPPMEEGFMLAFPEQVLKGAIPNRDFLHLYGPGSLWALAGVYKAFGVSLISERGFGLLQQLAIVFGIYALARRRARRLRFRRRHRSAREDGRRRALGTALGRRGRHLARPRRALPARLDPR